MFKPKIHSNLTRTLFFIAGIVSTFAYRAIVIVNNYSKFWAQMFWYTGTVGFIVYFLHRYQISQNRARLIKEHKLDSKIGGLKDLTEEEKEAMNYIFYTLKSSKEKWNSIFIFVSSAIALILGIYLDFIR
jgi:hypothetical protein